MLLVPAFDVKPIRKKLYSCVAEAGSIGWENKMLQITHQITLGRKSLVYNRASGTFVRYSTRSTMSQDDIRAWRRNVCSLLREGAPCQTCENNLKLKAYDICPLTLERILACFTICTWLPRNTDRLASINTTVLKVRKSFSLCYSKKKVECRKSVEK